VGAGLAGQTRPWRFRFEDPVGKT